VKVVHNGIEYGLMQLISEIYHLMKHLLGLNDDELHDVYHEWNQGELESFLLEITHQIFRYVDEKTGLRLIDKILDEAKQKGTGKWTSQDAMDLQVPVPTIDMAVAMRDLSGYKAERETASKILSGPMSKFGGDKKTFIQRLHNAFSFGMIATYSQGMALLKTASQAHNYGLQLDEVARIWRGGCIIRARLLEDIRQALKTQPDLPNLMLDAKLSQMLLQRQEDLRNIVKIAIESGIPAPGLMASLAYFDGYRSGWLPANLIQAQRDYFGSHTYERIDEKGTFHTQWDQG
jgi:6-phosphogluconate dehydrogenase